MNEPFDILVNYQGTEQDFKARFERWGYTHRIAVLIDETTFTFEPDEEGGYHAFGDQPGNTALLPNWLNSAIKKSIPTWKSAYRSYYFL